MSTETTYQRPAVDQTLAEAHALTVLFSPAKGLQGRIQMLPEWQRFELGRAPTSPGLAIDDKMLSRIHASISLDAASERYLLRDEGSLNGCFVNGEQTDRCLLAAGDILRLGDTVLLFARLQVGGVGWAAPPDCLLQGRSRALRKVLDEVDSAASSELPVLVVGETGSGKELLASELHRRSKAPGALVPVRCELLPGDGLDTVFWNGTAMREQELAPGDPAGGLLHAAWDGTLLLDRVEELEPRQQRILLGLLDDWFHGDPSRSQAGQGLPRLIATTAVDLRRRAEQGAFRPELYSRLAQWQIRLPPLRERPEDVLPILEQVIRQFGRGQPFDISADFFEVLVLYRWPFNARELVAGLRKALALLPGGGLLRRSHLPAEIQAPGLCRDASPTPGQIALPPPGRIPSGPELDALMRHYRGNIAEVARHTGRARAQIYSWLQRHCLYPENYRQGNDA